MIWIVFALLTGAAVMAVLAPLAIRGEARDPAAADVDFFKEQMAEIAREAAEGRLDAAEAEQAKTEAARRLLRAQSAAGVAAKSSRKPALVAALAAIAVIPAVALLLYHRVGHPEQPDMPLEARLKAPPPQDDMSIAVARIEEHLREHPEDGRGFEVIAPYLLRTGRTADAIHAYSEALRLLGPTADRHAALGEARLAEAQGKVTQEARADFEAALALDPKNPRALYYVGYAAAQDGDRAKAEEIWGRLLADAPPNAPYTQVVRRQLADLRGEAPPQQPPAASGPDSEQGKAIAAMPAEQRQQFIGAMVTRLAERLKQNSDDVEGWLKLLRAYAVLGEREKATGALNEARAALKEKPAELERVEALARQFDIKG